MNTPRAGSGSHQDRTGSDSRTWAQDSGGHAEMEPGSAWPAPPLEW